MKLYNKTLSEKFWNEKHEFDPSIKDKLLEIAQDFYDSLDIGHVDIKDIQLTGSMANFNYNDSSDLDVHILIDFKDVDENVELVEKALSGPRFIWNLRHNITMRGHDVELYVQDINEPHVASGLYSILNDEWVKTPSYDPPNVDMQDVDKKYNTIVRDIELIEEHFNQKDLDDEDLRRLHEKAEKLKSKISEDRSKGLKSEGLFSVENIVFKKLRNSDMIGKLINLISAIYSDVFSEGFDDLYFEFLIES
jgi:hypothetical protein